MAYYNASYPHKGEDERHVRLRPRQRVIRAERRRWVAAAQDRNEEDAVREDPCEKDL